MQMMSDLLSLLSQFIGIAGGIWAVWGVIVFALGLNDSNGQGIRSGLLQVVGGGLVIAAAVYLTTIV